jgi:ATP-dependent RNA helicase DHX37/DHR1
LTGQQEVEQLCRMLRKRYGNLAGKKKIKLLEKDGSDNEDENKNEDDNEAEEVETEEGVHVLPLYSLLPPKQQMLVFDQVRIHSTTLLVQSYRLIPLFLNRSPRARD